MASQLWFVLSDVAQAQLRLEITDGLQKYSDSSQVRDSIFGLVDDLVSDISGKDSIQKTDRSFDSMSENNLTGNHLDFATDSTGMSEVHGSQSTGGFDAFVQTDLIAATENRDFDTIRYLLSTG
eukprot:239782_1